jgi:hypothetical protein
MLAIANTLLFNIEVHPFGRSGTAPQNMIGLAVPACGGKL